MTVSGRSHVEYLVGALALEPHPEGGFYRRIYASDMLVDAGEGRFRPVCTAIIYLLQGRQFSAFHRIRSDEQWFLGETNTAFCLLELVDGELRETRLDRPNPVHCVKANTWFAGRLLDASEDSYAMVYCTVAPGFDFADFELANAGQLAAEFPAHAGLISDLSIG